MVYLANEKEIEIFKKEQSVASMSVSVRTVRKQNINNYMWHPPHGPPALPGHAPQKPQQTLLMLQARLPVVNCTNPHPQHLKPPSNRLRPRVSLRGSPGSEWSPRSVQGEVRTDKARGRASRKTCLPMAAGSRGESRARAAEAASLRHWEQDGQGQGDGGKCILVSDTLSAGVRTTQIE